MDTPAPTAPPEDEASTEAYAASGVFWCTDRHGEPHTYQVEYHPASEAIPISGQILALLGAPLVGALEGVLGSILDGDISIADALRLFGVEVSEEEEGVEGESGPAPETAEVGATDEAVDAEPTEEGPSAPKVLLAGIGVGDLAGDILRTVSERDHSDLIWRIMRHTTRDGEPLDRATFNRAYAGNLWELLHLDGALLKVIRRNGFLPF